MLQELRQCTFWHAGAEAECTEEAEAGLADWSLYMLVRHAACSEALQPKNLFWILTMWI